MQQPRKIAEGREAEIFAWEDNSVLRLMRSPDAARAVEWQAEALRAAGAAGVRVPDVSGTTTVDGRPGLIMERLDGTDLLTLVGRKPWLVFSAGAVSGRLHAELHAVRAPADLRALRLALRERLETSDLVPRELAAFALSVLEELPDGDRLLHGDFHPGNLIRTDGGNVIIDWTNVTRGDPTADYVRTDLMIRIGEIPPGQPLVIRYGAKVARGLMLGAYRRGYRRLRPIDDALAARWRIPVAAHRLTENIPGERDKLLRLLEETRVAS